MAALRRSFRWPSENKKTLTLAIPRSGSGFGFTVAWTKPPQVDFVNEDGTAAKSGLLPGDKIVCIDKIKVSKKSREEIENIVKKASEIMEVEILRPESELTTRKRQTSLRRKESFTRKGSRMVIQDADIILWRRERALLKLLLCEEDLLNIILLEKERIITPLRKQYTLSTPIELSILFGNIDEVGSMHERYVQQLRQLTQGNDDNVGRLYQNQIEERCAVLRKYVQGLPIAKILLKHKLGNKPFEEFVQKLTESTTVKPREADHFSKVLGAPEEKIDIFQLIEKPFQYIADLTIQLESVLNCTAVGHRDYVPLESVVRGFKDFCKEMKELIHKHSNAEDFVNAEPVFADEEPYVNLETLQEKTIFTKGPKNFSLVHPGRYWLFSGYLAKIEGRHYIQYWAVLLSDCLILTRRTEQRVLLVLDEPVMLRSVYQASFNEKCDTEFRILFAVQNPKRSMGRKNQWITWILRAPSAGIKLIWQTILTYQLSLYSTEALCQKEKSSFVHTKHFSSVRGFIPKKSSKYEESSFMNLSTSFPSTSNASQSYESTKLLQKEEESDNSIKGTESFVLSKSKGRAQEILKEMKKDGSYFSLNENIMMNNDIRGSKVDFIRSSSLCNDFSESIPYIDSIDENNSGTESIIVSPHDSKSDSEVIDKKSKSDVDEMGCIEGSEGGNQRNSDAQSTPEKSDKCVQTGESGESWEVVCSKKTPKKKFPRLGTFERIKIDKKSSSENVEPSNSSRTRTGTSFRHRRHVTTTSSKEHLLHSISPGETEKKDITDALQQPAVPKKSKNIFSRFWKKDSKVLISQNSESGLENEGLSSVLQCDNYGEMEKPPDYDTAISLPDSSNTNDENAKED